MTTLDRVSFILRRGRVLGLIGPNGAGKTTICERARTQRPLRSAAAPFSTFGQATPGLAAIDPARMVQFQVRYRF